MRKLVPLIIASIMVFVGYGCEEGYWDDFPKETEKDLPEEFLRGQVSSESITVFPGESVKHVLDGVVSLEFPEGAVKVPTTFTLSASSLDNNGMHGCNLMNRAVSLEPELAFYSRDFEIPVKITMNYDVARFMCSLKRPEDKLTIFSLNDIFYAFSIGECCVDCECKIVEGSIDQCGIFVVGER